MQRNMSLETYLPISHIARSINLSLRCQPLSTLFTFRPSVPDSTDHFGCVCSGCTGRIPLKVCPNKIGIAKMPICKGQVIHVIPMMASRSVATPILPVCMMLSGIPVGTWSYTQVSIKFLLEYHVVRPSLMPFLTLPALITTLDAVVDHHGERKGLRLHSGQSDVEQRGRQE
jgi:hypothetical protein